MLDSTMTLCRKSTTVGLVGLTLATAATALVGAARGQGAWPSDGPGKSWDREPHRLEVSGKPAYLWLWYADGTAMPAYAPNCSNLAPPPAYQCNFGDGPNAGLQDCQQQVQAYLDDWYQDFNLVFTLARPPSDDYYTIAITSAWPMCATTAAQLTGGLSNNEGGIATMNCLDNVAYTAVAIQCGTNAHDCAATIAHEHGHLVGLVHTTSKADVMNPSVQSTATGFPNASSPVVQDLANACNESEQNSYHSMLLALGSWPGGAKPTLFPLVDAAVVSEPAGSPDAALPNTADAATEVGRSEPESGTDGGIALVAGLDAFSRAAPVTAGPELPTATAPTPSGTACNLAHGHGSPSALAVGAALLSCLGARKGTRLARRILSAERRA